jgi:CheY-like chemotaxis protein
MSDDTPPLHRLNNLLVPLVGYRDLLERRFNEICERVSDPDLRRQLQEIRQLVGEMSDAGDRAAVLVQDIHREATGGALAAPPEPVTNGRPAQRVGTILLVESHEAIRDGMARALRDAGYDVVECQDAEHCQEVMTTHPCDIRLIVSDARHRLNEFVLDVPMVLLADPGAPSARGTTQVPLTKPFSNRELIRAVHGLLAHK